MCVCSVHIRPVNILTLTHTHSVTHVHTQVDQWVDYVTATVVTGSGLEAVLSALNDFLALRSYMVGYGASLADVALWGQLQGEPGVAGVCVCVCACVCVCV